MIIALIIFILLIGPLLGSFFGVYKKYSEVSIDKMLAFAAGVMIAISVFQLIPQSIYGAGFVTAVLGILIGIILMLILNFTIPHYHHSDKYSKLKMTAWFLFLGISIHNFPEGLAVGASGIGGLNFSLLTALAIAIHDIPETVCVAAPFCLVLKNSKKAFWLSSLSAIPTIFGFFVSYFLLRSMPSEAFSLIISVTAGAMLYVSIIEILLPIFNKKKNLYDASLYVVVGAAFALLMQAIIS